ncbi:MAG: hypothetical protein ACO35C_04420 [Pontimonas sp.]
MIPETPLPAFVETYVAHVCPLRRNVKTPVVPCIKQIPVPPVDVQQGIVDVVEALPDGLKGIMMDAILSGRIADAHFIADHVDEFLDFERIYRISEESINEDLPPFDPLFVAFPID